MSFKHTKKVKMEKIATKDEIQYFLDYYKHKDSNNFLKEVIREFSEERCILLVIDMDNFYDKKGSAAEEAITEIKRQLDQQRIGHREVMTKRESEDRIFGIRIQKSEKENSYMIGIAAAPEQLTELIGIFMKYNVFCYIPANDMPPAQLLDIFSQVRGDYDELKAFFMMNLYMDCYLRRIRICGIPDAEYNLEEKLLKYN